MARRRGMSWRRRGDASLRILAAMPVGYAVASLWAMALARLLPMTPAGATVTATMVAFALCAGAAMWAYAARSGWRALWTLLVAGAVAGAIAWLSVAMGGRV
ncbi:hypothetical protein [Sphingomonas mollis]|uniref:DUF3649 domain-containing protein n=1 Tax=Sphingomonas mollis TaxID=2795726 RepID=A0ABS0XU79_9SPHN|nr:hypothetical protein [Sphingomonas sp. BT553]MBJ6123303.1 hypothetical protein [Sphingomonas sp. BT553]